MTFRVKMRRDVTTDLPGIVFGPQPLARAGEIYEVTFNDHGAVTADVNGEQLGLKPDEFDFVCPLVEDGVTRLVNHQWRVYSKDKPGAGFALLDRVEGEWRWHWAELV